MAPVELVHPGVAVMRHDGELTSATSPVFSLQLGEALTGQHKLIVVDMAGASFVDSSGLGALIGAMLGIGTTMSLASGTKDICDDYKAYGTCPNAGTCQTVNDAKCEGTFTYNRIKNVQILVGTCKDVSYDNLCEDTILRPTCQKHYYKELLGDADCDSMHAAGCSPQTLGWQTGC